jgi:AcrR family transcriptional regulator
MASTTRAPITRDRVMHAAIELADAHGIDAVTMRRVAESLEVEGMSLYHHVANKDAILDGLAELVFVEINAAIRPHDDDALNNYWKAQLRDRILTARSVLLRHPWAPALIESRPAIGLPQAQYADAVVGIMRAGGLSFDLIHHSLHALGSRMFGFSQEMNEETDTDMTPMAEVLPNLVAMLSEVAHDDPGATLGWCDDQTEFEFGLDLILDGVERLARRSG